MYKLLTAIKVISFTSVIASMMFAGLAQSPVWFVTMWFVFCCWILLEFYLDERDHRIFWQGLTREMYHRKNRT